MPIFEHACRNVECARYGEVEEHYFRSSDPEPSCPSCGQLKGKIISSFGVIWTGPITARYNRSESENPFQEGHWAYSKKSPDGKLTPVLIDSWAAQKAFCKAEGLLNPNEINPNAEISSDGKKLYTSGVKGQWY